ncbi:hypothetical protein TNCV_36991 [Trichonephila clavipes]|nr:hypothetical protein TNCV_36991 [Trichonephila clavipes]
MISRVRNPSRGVFHGSGFCNVEEPRHDAITWSGATTEEDELRREVWTGLVVRRQICPTVQRTGRQVRSNEVVSKNAGSNID